MTLQMIRLLNMPQEISNVHVIMFKNGISSEIKVYNELGWWSRDNLSSLLFPLVSFMMSFYKVRSRIQDKITET